MAFTLPDLPYDYSALEPHIDARTMEIHHTKHHQAYIHNLIKALDGHDDLLNMPIVELMRNLDKVPQDKRQAVINNGGGHLNHCLFWKIMSPKGSPEPTGEVLEAINGAFGDFATFKEKFNTAAQTRFGSGWAWLCLGTDGKLHVESSANQDTPVSAGHTPILGLDVWEHAYYLTYQNRRPDYIGAWWNVVNWDEVANNLKTAKAQPGVLASVR
ncbi:MAG: superoxide dismutase [Candidatus Sericytochromatia bacterium]